MASCSVLYVKRNKVKKTRKQKTFIWLSLILVFFVIIITFFTAFVNPIIVSVSTAKIKSLSTRALSTAVGDIVNGTVVYDNLIRIKTDSAGNINLIQADGIELNRLSQSLIRASQEKLETIGEQGILIPLGNFSGIPIFSGVGPKIKIKVMPVGNVESKFFSQFTTAGVNQTNHRIYINLSANVSLVLPGNTTKVTTVTQLLICESVIIGQVPDTYLNSDNLDEMLNLVN